MIYLIKYVEIFRGKTTQRYSSMIFNDLNSALNVFSKKVIELEKQRLSDSIVQLVLVEKDNDDLRPIVLWNK